MSVIITLLKKQRKSFNPALYCCALICLTVLLNFDVFSQCTLKVNIKGEKKINCTTPSTILTANSRTTGLTFSWTGPDGFTSTLLSPTITAGGFYTVVATDPATNCTAQDTVTITANFNSPKVTGKGGTITCTNSSVTLSATSPNANVTFSWTGPGGFTSSSPNPVVLAGGTYTLTGINSNSGCSGTDTAVVKLDTIGPQVSAIGATIGCTTTGVTINASSSTSGATFAWTGPGGFTSVIANPSVSVVGTYTVTVTNPVNGCKRSATVVVTRNNSITVTATGGSLPCTGPGTTTISASSPASGVTFAWTGPGGFTSNIPDPSVSVAGTYIVTATQTSSGCTATATAVVSASGALNVTATGGTITCTNTRATLGATSSTTGVTFAWTGPGGYTSNIPNPSVSVAGTYTVTATAPGGCSASATVTVTQSTTIPVVTATGGTITCASAAVILTASSTTSGLTYAWTGPGGFTSNLQNPAATVAGTYTVLGTNPATGCCISVPVVVNSNTTLPPVSASGATITCSTAPVIIVAQSPLPTVTYRWTGPGGFTANIPNPTVTVPGTYVVTATNSVNGCTNSATIVVNQNTTLPVIVINGTKKISCAALSTVLTASSSTSGLVFNWSGPGGFTFNGASATITAGGFYTVVATDPVNGCTATDTATVVSDFIAPQVTATGGTISCATSSVIISATSTTPGVTFAWTGPGGFTSNTSNTSVSTPGTYLVTVTNPSNGCTATATVSVNPSGTPPNVTATGGTITCGSQSVVIVASSTTPGVTYSWTGPGGFTSNVANPTVSVAGTYTVTATANGCTASATATVTSGSSSVTVTATGGTISCTNPTVTLTASSTTAGVLYSWTGPGGFTSNISNPVVSVAGTYIVTATVPGSVCRGTATVVVNQTSTKVNVKITGVKRINCATPTTVLTASSTTSGVTFSWSGPGGFTSSIPNPTISVGGFYTVVATNPLNGCSGNDTVTINANFNIPKVTGTGGKITCTSTTVTLGASSPNQNVTFTWTGPGGFTSGNANPTVSVAGVYTVTGLNTNNGCSATDTALVRVDTIRPVVTTVGGSITCTTLSVIISASSSTPGVTYAWNGPGGFTSTVSNPTVSIAGVYAVTATNPANGCTSSALTVVNQNSAAPPLTATGALITCSTAPVIIVAQSPLPTVSYSWTGPGGFTSNIPNPVVTIPGNYVVTATNTSTGCTSTATVVVSQNIIRPNVKIQGRKKITCSTPTTVLTASSNAAGATFNWTGPGGFTSNLPNPTISAGGLYTVVATNPVNGCTALDTAFINQNFNSPRVNATGGTITCTNPTVTLNASSPNDIVTFIWTGPNGFTSDIANPIVSVPGSYVVTGTNTNNGCTGTATVQVVNNTALPICAINVPSLTPLPSTSITATATSSPNTTYSWSLISSSSGWSISGSTTNVSAVINTGVAGTQATVTLVVVNTRNGCRQTCQITLTSASRARATANSENLRTDNSSSYELTHANPLSEQSSIKFSSFENIKAKIEVYSFMGRKIETLFEDNAKANEQYNLFLKRKDLPSGVYIIKLTIDNQTYLKRILFNK